MSQRSNGNSSKAGASLADRYGLSALRPVVFSQLSYRKTSGFPAISLWSDQAEIIVLAELPDVDPAAIAISVRDRTLHLGVSRKPTGPAPKTVKTYQMLDNIPMTGSISLPYAVDTDHIEAGFEEGVLHIKLPRVPSGAPYPLAEHLPQ